MDFIVNFLLFLQFPVVKEYFENRLRFDDVTAMSLVAPFLGHGVYHYCNDIGRYSTCSRDGSMASPAIYEALHWGTFRSALQVYGYGYKLPNYSCACTTPGHAYLASTRGRGS